jgi:DNA-binding CsgD family transcriptional regulator
MATNANGKSLATIHHGTGDSVPVLTARHKTHAPSGAHKRHKRALTAIFAAVVFQAICAVPFLYNLWAEVLGIGPRFRPWWAYEVSEILASIGLVSGVVAAVLYLRASRALISQMDRQIGAMTGDFHSQLMQQFRDWRLSPSESEIAIYAMKGYSNAEIGDLRNTSAATVKGQMNSIYRKSGVANRQQLISLLVEEFLHDRGTTGYRVDPDADRAGKVPATNEGGAP